MNSGAEFYFFPDTPIAVSGSATVRTTDVTHELTSKHFIDSRHKYVSVQSSTCKSIYTDGCSIVSTEVNLEGRLNKAATFLQLHRINVVYDSINCIKKAFVNNRCFVYPTEIPKHSLLTENFYTYSAFTSRKGYKKSKQTRVHNVQMLLLIEIYSDFKLAPALSPPSLLP